MRLTPTLPPTVGHVLQTEYLTPLNIEVAQLARALSVPTIQILALLDGRTGCNVAMALRLAIYFQNLPEYWLGKQMQYEIAYERQRLEFSLRAVETHPMIDGVLKKYPQIIPAHSGTEAQ